MNGMDHRYLDGSGIDARSYCDFTPRRMPVPTFALSKLPPEDSGYLVLVHPHMRAWAEHHHACGGCVLEHWYDADPHRLCSRGRQLLDEWSRAAMKVGRASYAPVPKAPGA